MYANNLEMKSIYISLKVFHTVNIHYWELFLPYEEFTDSRLDVHFNDSECSNKTSKLVALSGMYSQKAGEDVLSNQ